METAKAAAHEAETALRAVQAQRDKMKESLAESDRCGMQSSVRDVLLARLNGLDATVLEEAARHEGLKKNWAKAESELAAAELQVSQRREELRVASSLGRPAVDSNQAMMNVNECEAALKQLQAEKDSVDDEVFDARQRHNTARVKVVRLRKLSALGAPMAAVQAERDALATLQRAEDHAAKVEGRLKTALKNLAGARALHDSCVSFEAAEASSEPHSSSGHCTGVLSSPVQQTATPSADCADVLEKARRSDAEALASSRELVRRQEESVASLRTHVETIELRLKVLHSNMDDTLSDQAGNEILLKAVQDGEVELRSATDRVLSAEDVLKGLRSQVEEQERNAEALQVRLATDRYKSLTSELSAARSKVHAIHSHFP